MGFSCKSPSLGEGDCGLTKPLGFGEPSDMIARPKSLLDQVVEWLREGARAGRWSAGLPGLGTLAREYGVAEGTVRRAVRLLEKEGVFSYAGAGRRRQVVLGADEWESQARASIAGGGAVAGRAGERVRRLPVDHGNGPIQDRGEGPPNGHFEENPGGFPI